MATTAKRDEQIELNQPTEELIDQLKDLAELEYDVADAYAAAVERMDDKLSRDQLTAIKDEHERRLAQLNVFIFEMGGKPAVAGDFRGVLVHGRVAVGGITGDTGVLKAMRANEKYAVEAYERVLKRTRGSLSPDITSFVQQVIRDERLHGYWFDERLKELERRKN